MSSGQSPSAEEYLKNGVVSTGVHVTLTHVFFLLGEAISKETVELFDEDLDIISSSATVLRLWDDMGSAKVSLINYVPISCTYSNVRF